MRHLSKVVLVILALTFGYRSLAQTVSLSERDWYIRSSREVEVTGEVLSSGADFKAWTKVSVPSTVLGGLCEAGEYENIFFDDNLAKVDASRFRDPWWYCTSFALDKFNPETEELTLVFEGINYRADVFLNGRQIMSSDKAYGAYRVLKCDITEYADWINDLAVKITPPEVGDFYMGFVDWAPAPPDRNMGIHRPVLVKRSGKVTLDNPFVKTDLNTETLAEAALTVSTEIANHANVKKKAVVKAVIEGKTVKTKVKLYPGESRTVVFSPDKYRKLHISNPRVWWPNGLGKPEMYSMSLSVSLGGKVSDCTDVDFGIRTVETYMDEREVRGYKINGRPTLIKGAGYCDDMFLRNDRKRYEAEIGYVKDMNLNCIRLEGIWGNSQDLYDICDRNGILLMLGWSCQWEWPDYLGYEMEVKEEDTNIAINEGIEKYGVQMSERQEQDLADYFEDQVKWLRNHPSVFVWVVGSDGMPKASLEAKYDEILKKYDDTRSLLVSAGDFTSTMSGRTGMKMNGPYDYVAPIYWFEDKTLGGAFGFNTEVGPGPQVPLRGSIEKMIPADKLWPYTNKSWIYHSGQKNFAELDVYNDAIDARYGKSSSLDEYVMKAQWINYEAVKAMFEAHVVNRPEATGVIQWQLNSPWPEFYWQLYDWYLMPTGAYYGTKKGCQPRNLIYNYSDRKLYACNDALEDLNGCKAVSKLFDSQSKEIWSFEKNLDIPANSGIALAEIPALENPKGTYFLKTEILDAEGESIADNFYWLSGTEDKVKYEEYHWCFTPTAKYADFSELSNLPKADVKARINVNRNGNVTVRLTNVSDKIAFCVQLVLSDREGNYITPVKWSDNYFSMLGGETKEVTVNIGRNLSRCQLAIEGVNIEKTVIKK